MVGKNNPKQQNKRKGKFKFEKADDFFEVVVKINRVAKVVKGGRRFSLTAFVVVGDKKGSIGFGSGKAKEVPDAIRKAVQDARKNMTKFVTSGVTIPYTVTGVFRGAKVLLKPAREGTGLIAGSAVRAVVEGLGIHDILTKSLGSDNTVNIVKAAFDALSQLRSKSEVEKLRGVYVDEN